MSEAVQLALINQMPSILTAIGVIMTAIIGWLNLRKTDKVATHAVANSNKVDQVLQQTNGNLTHMATKNEALEKTVSTLLGLLNEDRRALAAAGPPIAGTMPMPYVRRGDPQPHVDSDGLPQLQQTADETKAAVEGVAKTTKETKQLAKDIHDQLPSKDS